MINVRKDEATGEAEVVFDDESLQGNQCFIRLEDQAGLEMIARLCDFYEAKGYNPVRLLNLAKKAQRKGLWARLFGG